MILTPFGPTIAYRMHTPRWAGTPTSGAGAGVHGGRANRPGTDALYLALDIETAVREYQQSSPLMPPGTLVSYTVTLTKTVDFSNGYQPLTWEPLWEDFHCDWRELWFNQRVEPPSWVLADQALGQGAKGICFRSRLTGGTNVVVYTGQLVLGTEAGTSSHDHLQAHDPGGALPRNQDSWR
ncbi:MAG: RES family NAD+ phosphorylase [Rhodoferax sp.]|nr:RES family NAD+ phosphorylase [Rhodoferax sp.]